MEQALHEAAIVFDKLLSLRSTLRAASGWLSPCGRLHIIKHLNEVADKIRRQEHRRLSAAGYRILTDTKYLWLQRRENPCQRAAVEFRSLLGQDLQAGTAQATELTPLVKAAVMIDKYTEGILNYLMHPICLQLCPLRSGSNAAAEGINSVIQSLKHAAHKLPQFESFRIRVLLFLGKLDLNPA